MKKIEQINPLKEILRASPLFQLYDKTSFYKEAEEKLSHLQKISQSLCQKTKLSKREIADRFNVLWEDLRRLFHSQLDLSFIEFEKELKNIDILILYLRNGEANLKELETRTSKFLGDLLKTNEINDKETLENLILLNPLKNEAVFRDYHHFLSESVKKAELLSTFASDLEKEFTVLMNSFDSTKGKLLSTSRNSHSLESILQEIREIPLSLTPTSSEQGFSAKNPSEIQKKREIPTSHVKKTYQKMFSPSEYSIMKIIHFRDNFYLTCGWDGNVNITNALGKKTTLNFEAHSLPIRDVAKIQPNIFVTTGDDCRTKVWNLDGEPILLSEMDTNNDKIRCLLSVGGLCEGSLVLGGDSGVLRIYDLGLFQKEFEGKISEFGLTSLSALQGTEKALIGSSQGEIFCFDLKSRKILKTFPDAHSDWITSFSVIQKHGNYEAAKNELTLVKNVKCDGWVLKTLHFKQNILAVACSKCIYFIDTEKGSIIKKIEHIHEANINDICLSKKDASLLTVGQDESNNIKELSD